ncbi:hypothetical protein DBV15_09099 [Temnothorax longispinosus]|uniref:Ig-like domain-containing protein n=1 Tax=Temnothorax longispinosus TaxID=300112 RepID=A0A4S2KP03_9HYME|nr:hypothetical protein DBV15_09099 [Temnothorax longispinosus]
MSRVPKFVYSYTFDLSLLIAVAPIASLKIGSTLNPKNIKEGSDVYFECNVRANPRSYKLTWFHEDQCTILTVNRTLNECRECANILQSTSRVTLRTFTEKVVILKVMPSNALNILYGFQSATYKT